MGFDSAPAVLQTELQDSGSFISLLSVQSQFNESAVGEFSSIAYEIDEDLTNLAAVAICFVRQGTFKLQSELQVFLICFDLKYFVNRFDQALHIKPIAPQVRFPSFNL